MKRALVAFAIVAAATLAQADNARLDKAKAEGKVAFYANITAVEPIMNASEPIGSKMPISASPRPNSSL